MELCVSTTASVRATAAPISFAPPRRGASASTALPLHRRIPTRDDGGLDEILSKLNIEVTPILILTGSGAFVALWILSSVVSAVDSVPLLPKLLELVGTGYSIWFTARHLLFKESRDGMFAKFKDIKERII
ncbi:Protein CURVATURE THYLAKOID 1D chloroplastic [Zea mays]|uniref:Protein CURVATURE THYLAKOID 1D chloroplastic n=1 Tax=Zea mays TaxID=4577 RepID=A0A1D6QE39_MAIZE|nr:Protein CURVATURE THYLAKOID 1D chloroplastic [Zea mays]